MYKKLLILLLLVSLGCPVLMATGDLKSEESDLLREFFFDDWNASFILPSDKWSFIGDQVNEKLKAAMFSFRREGFTDKSQMIVNPNVTFIFEKVPPNTVLANYSNQSLKRVPLIIKKKFSAADGTILLKNALGYIGVYHGPDNKDHTVVLLHALSGGKGMQVIMDITTELAPKVINEFYAILRSIKFK